MGGMTVSSGGTQTQFGVAGVNAGLLSDHLASADRSFSLHRSLHRITPKRRPDFVVKAEHGRHKPNKSPKLTLLDSLPLLNDSLEKRQEFISRASQSGKTPKPSSRIKVAALKKDSTCTLSAEELDYGEAAATLENIYNDSPASVSGSDLGFVCSDKPQTQRKKRTFGLHTITDEDNCKFPFSEGHSSSVMPKKLQKSTTKKKFRTSDPENKDKPVVHLVRSSEGSKKRLSLDSRIALRKTKLENKRSKDQLQKKKKKTSKISDKITNFWCEEVDELIKTYRVSLDFMSLDWSRLRIVEVLSHDEHIWLSKLMQPMKSLLRVKQSLAKALGRDPREDEIATALKMDVGVVKRQMEAGQAARNKLIQHNLRLVLFEVYKYNIEDTGLSFNDACQEGVKGLMVAVDKFEPKKGFRLSTYALFWIRHYIMRSITLSNLRRTPFTITSLKLDIQRATLDLVLDLGRSPTHEEIMSRVGLAKDRYRDVLQASKKIFSLNEYHRITKEQIIDGVADPNKVENELLRPQKLLRLALDDVLDSLNPKESLVIKQRFGLDGKGERSLAEIACNLKVSREMVRKYEAKALMKLRQPSQVDYLQGCFV